MSLMVKILWKIYKTPLILFHAARFKTWQTGVRPAVHLSWKGLLYSSIQIWCHMKLLIMKEISEFYTYIKVSLLKSSQLLSEKNSPSPQISCHFKDNGEI